jgi:hypothetical protein
MLNSWARLQRRNSLKRLFLVTSGQFIAPGFWSQICTKSVGNLRKNWTVIMCWIMIFEVSVNQSLMATDLDEFSQPKTNFFVLIFVRDRGEIKESFFPQSFFVAYRISHGEEEKIIAES